MGTEDRTNDTIPFSGGTPAKGRLSIQVQKLVYLIIMYFYSRVIKIVQLDKTTAEAVIQHCKIIFSSHEKRKEVATDNGSQFDFNAFRRLSKEYQFRHITSSVYYPRSNGVAERGVKKSDEPYLALLAYRSTPLSNAYLPAELQMNKKLRTNVPSSREAWKSHVPDMKFVVQREEKQRQKQNVNFDRCHRAQDLSPALPGDLVWILDRREQGTIGDEIVLQ